MKVAAFAYNHGDRAGELADASGEDMANQEREPHCSHPYRPSTMPDLAMKTRYALSG
jgi:hypothetical protein